MFAEQNGLHMLFLEPDLVTLGTSDKEDREPGCDAGLQRKQVRFFYKGRH